MGVVFNAESYASIRTKSHNRINTTSYARSIKNADRKKSAEEAVRAIRGLINKF